MIHLLALTEIQAANGWEMGGTLQSNHAQTFEIVLLVTHETLVKYIIVKDVKVAFMINESTTDSKKRLW
jgi:hypothetical protein